MDRPVTSHIPVRGRAARRGMSLIEVMISAGVLGVAVLAVISLFTHVERGQGVNKDLAIARAAAAERIEQVTTLRGDNLPSCAGAVGCALNLAEAAPTLGAAGGYQCTQYMDEVLPPPETATQPSKYRVDTVVVPHPDNLRFPDARMVVVSVCWFQDDRVLYQVQSRRVVIPGV